MKRQQNISIPQELLDRLKAPPLGIKLGYYCIDGLAVEEVAKLIGAPCSQEGRWLYSINWLDENYPGWRGYPNPVVANTNLLQLQEVA